MNKSKGWDEIHLSEDPAVELLQELGYSYIEPETLESERDSLKETVLTDRLGTALRKLNPWWRFRFASWLTLMQIPVEMPFEPLVGCILVTLRDVMPKLSL